MSAQSVVAAFDAFSTADPPTVVTPTLEAKDLGGPAPPIDKKARRSSWLCALLPLTPAPVRVRVEASPPALPLAPAAPPLVVGAAVEVAPSAALALVRLTRDPRPAPSSAPAVRERGA